MKHEISQGREWECEQSWEWEGMGTRKSLPHISNSVHLFDEDEVWESRIGIIATMPLSLTSE